MKIFGNKLLMKLMSTVTIFSMVLALIYTPLDVYADDSVPAIVSVAVKESSPNAIHVFGACKDVSAVLVQIYAGNDLVNMQSAYTKPVTGNAKYNRSYDVTVEGSYKIGQKYTVYVTDYEGKLAAMSKDATISAKTRDNDKYVSVDVSGRIGLVGYYKLPDTCKYLYIDGVMYNRSDIPCDEYGYVRIKKYCSAKNLGEKLNVYALKNNELPSSPGSTPDFSVSVRDLQCILDDSYSSEDYSDDLKNLVKSLLHYGDAVQRYFNYNVSELIENIDENNEYSIQQLEFPEITYYVDEQALANEHHDYLGKSLILGDTTTLRIYFKGNMSGYFANILDYDDYELVNTNKGYSYVDINNITPFDYDRTFDINIYKKLDEMNMLNITTISTSVNNYFKDAYIANGCKLDGQYKELMDVLISMQYYSKYCKAYFESQN